MFRRIKHLLARRRSSTGLAAALAALVHEVDRSHALQAEQESATSRAWRSRCSRIRRIYVQGQAMLRELVELFEDGQDGDGMKTEPTW